jgi:hypothetical protein
MRLVAFRYGPRFAFHFFQITPLCCDKSSACQSVECVDAVSGSEVESWGPKPALPVHEFQWSFHNICHSNGNHVHKLWLAARVGADNLKHCVYIASGLALSGSSLLAQNLPLPTNLTMATPSTRSLIPPNDRGQSNTTFPSSGHHNIQFQIHQPLANTQAGSLNYISNSSRNSIDGRASTDNVTGLLGNQSSLSLGKLPAFTL